MSGLLDINVESLEKSLSLTVPEIYVVIAKHSVLGMDSESLRELLDCTKEELAEIESDESYKTVRQYIGARYAQQGVEQTAGWDQIEQVAIANLAKRVPFEKDGEFLLRVAAVANRAQRRHQKVSGVLDPSLQSGRTVITLTQRLTQRLAGPVEADVIVTRQLSITDGSMVNPSFEEVDNLLAVTGPRQSNQETPDVV